MYSQANVRAGKWPRPPPRALPSVIVDTEKVLREADGSVKLVVVRPHTDGKVFAPGCASKSGRESRRGARRTQAIKGESAEFEWNIFPGFTTLQLCDKITELLSSLGQSPEAFTGRILFMSMFNDISCEGKGNKEQRLKDADFVKTFARRFGIGQNGLSLDQVLRKSGILLKTARKENGTILQRICCLHLQKVDIPSSVQQHHCPGDN